MFFIYSKFQLEKLKKELSTLDLESNNTESGIDEEMNQVNFQVLSVE